MPLSARPSFARGLRSPKARRAALKPDEPRRRLSSDGPLNGLEPCSPDEVGLDSKSLEEHRLRNSWQSSLGILPGNAECVISGDRLAYLELMGWADVERGTPFRESTLCRCFSMTKPITAVAVARLVEERKLAWNDPVAKYIPSFRDMKVVKKSCSQKWGVTADSVEDVEPCRRPITIRHLLTHTSGLSYGPDRVSPKVALKASCAAEGSYLQLVQDVDAGCIHSLREFCDALAQLPLRFQPGTQWTYSHGVDVAGRIIEIVSGKPLDVFLREEVFEPLGMNRTSFFVGRGRARDLAALYLGEQKKHMADEKLPQPEGRRLCRLRRVDGVHPEESRWYGGRHSKSSIVAGGGIMGSCAGGLVSCLHDMAGFICMLSSGGKAPSGKRLLQPSTMRALCQDWLALRSVVGHTSGRDKKLPGWPYGANVGWTPLGHVRKRDQCLFMGGWSTSWAVYPKTHLATLSMSQCLVYFDVPGWVSRKDELDAAVEFGVANQRRRHTALRRHQFQALQRRDAAAGQKTKRKAAPAAASPPAKRRRSRGE